MIVQLQERDHGEALDFLDLVFSAQRPHDFASMLPLCYRPEDMHHNWAIREEGRIRAIVGLFPREWRVGEHSLRVACIGGVSTHPRSRGQGHMRQLMAHCLQQMDDCDLSWLAGRRSRYAHHGYEVCGLSLQTRLAPDDLPPGTLEIRALGPEHLDACWALHERLPIRHPRAREHLYGYLTAWHHQPFVALESEGRVAGYLVYAPDRDQLAELRADEGMTVPVLGAWLAHSRQYTTLLHPPLPADELHVLASWPYSTGNWRIFRWERVLEALLSVRPSMGPVLPGVCTLGIEGWGALRLECDGQRFQLESRPLSEATHRFDPALTMRLLFGPLRPAAVTQLPTELALLDQWCPLPLYWARQDGV